MIRAPQDRDVLVVSGVRTPFAAAWTLFDGVPAVELARVAVREAVERAELASDEIDEVVLGTVASPAEGTDPARVVALGAKIPPAVPALTVNRGCATGLEAVAQAACRIRSGDAEIVVAAAVESLSGSPFLPSRAEGRAPARAGRPGLRRRSPGPPSALALQGVDPASGLTPGESAERLAREFDISREEQDAFALESHRRAASAWAEGRMDGEVAPVPIPPLYEIAAERDNGVREALSSDALAALPPAVDRRFGTVTAGNAFQPADGAVALVLASRARACSLSLAPMGRVAAWGFAGCDPARMGLGPVFAVPLALRGAGGVFLDQVDLVEIHEAFAAQVLACLRAFASRAFCEAHLSTGPLGAVDPARLNVNGGAIAIGHPIGASGARLVLTLLREMRRRGARTGLAASCAGGGQGGAVLLESE